jgi:hypothetical protein
MKHHPHPELQEAWSHQSWGNTGSSTCFQGLALPPRAKPPSLTWELGQLYPRVSLQVSRTHAILRRTAPGTGLGKDCHPQHLHQAGWQ